MYQMSHYGYSGLEQAAMSQAVFYSAAAPIQRSYEVFMPSFTSQRFNYSTGTPLEQPQQYAALPSYTLLFTPQAEYHFQPDHFLIPGKGSRFVGRAEEIQEEIEEAFQKIFSQTLPNDIKISILDEAEFSKIAPSPGVVGLSINRSQQGLLSEIFILNDSLGRVMLTIGHELGHVLSPTLESAHDEEAKAYAFSLLWMKVIKEHNIANLGDAIVLENPAHNGLHDLSFGFVHQLLKEKSAEEIYRELLNGNISFNAWVV